jgi:hypothetical protein
VAGCKCNVLPVVHSPESDIIELITNRIVDSQNMRIAKILIFATIFWVIFGLVKNLLLLMNIVHSESTHTILFSIAATLLLAFTYKHRHWIAACIFLGINEILKYISQKIPTVNSVILPQTQDYFFIIVAGMLSLILSLLFILRFLRIDYENYYLFNKQKA